MICNKIINCFNKQVNCSNYELSNKSKIVSQENNKRYCLLNSDNSLIGKAHIDGGCVKDGTIKKCDYLLEFKSNDGFMIGVFIELKGRNFIKGLLQISATLDYFSFNFKKCFARIVCSSGAKFITADPKCVALKRKMIKLGGNLLWFANSSEEDINSFKNS